ncbi:hypothetical protein QSI_2982 [Clostridioides difficile P28]|nr:hypothetical protein QSI_2982 [Clostridioides difficile P28]
MIIFFKFKPESSSLFMSFGQRSEQYMPETRNVNMDNTEIRTK